MKTQILPNFLNSNLLTQLKGIVSVVLVVAAVVVLIIPYTVLKMLVCYTPVGKVSIPVSLL